MRATMVPRHHRTSAMTSVPLSLLDELYLNLDRGQEPWTVHFEFCLPVHLDAERLADAIPMAAARPPLARARPARRAVPRARRPRCRRPTPGGRAPASPAGGSRITATSGRLPTSSSRTQLAS